MDRVAQLSLHDAAKGKGKPGKPMKRREAQKRATGGSKVPRTDSGSDGSMMDVCCAQTSDSAQSSMAAAPAQAVCDPACPACPAAAAAAAPAPAPAPAPAAGPRPGSSDDCAAHLDAAADALVASEDIDCSGSEVDGPAGVVADKYIKGTRLIIGGWFQACRGCNEPTAHTHIIGGRDVPLCPRCQGKYSDMISGDYPPNMGAAIDAAVEPLCYWLPRVLGAVPRMEDAARKAFCDQLVLRQDDAWVALIKSSA